MAETEADVRDDWHRYRKHLEKSRMTGCLLTVHPGRLQLKDFKNEYMGDNEISKQLDNVKQFGFYTDCIGDGLWISPERKIGKETAGILLALAHVQCCDGKKFLAREIELWRECLSPFRHAPYEKMRIGLLEWHRRMVSEGLRKEDQGFVDFVVGGEI